MTIHYWEGTFSQTTTKWNSNDNSPKMLTADNLVLRGSILRNTKFIVGIVVNMANDTLI